MHLLPVVLATNLKLHKRTKITTLSVESKSLNQRTFFDTSG